VSFDFNALRELGEKLDTNNMLGLVSSIPSHMGDGWAIGGEFAAGLKKTTASRIVVCGMGGSAIGGDMVRSALGDRLAVPLVANRSYRVPPSLARDAVFVFSSYSGNTAETLSAYDGLRGSGRPSFAITSGGELAARCEADGVPVCKIPGGMPPRSAIAYSFFPLLRILTALGLADATEGEYEEARQALEKLSAAYRSDDTSNRAATLAYALEGKLPFVYSTAGLMEAVARRWCTQINENSKSLAHLAVFPELTHNEIVGWEALPDLREGILIVRLDDEDDDPSARRQADIAMEVIEPHCAAVVTESARGGRMTRILSVMMLGDFVSVYLGYLNGVDPTPVKNIDILKGRMKAGG
jgi:glucose/mannose-6-phosphate isomerase